MPESRLDGDQGAARTQELCRLGEAGRERPLERDVMERQPVQDYVERRGRKAQPAGVSDMRLVGSPGLHDLRDGLWVGIDGDEPEFGCRKQVAARIPTAPDRQHVTTLDAQPRGEEELLAQHDLSVVDPERRGPAEAVQDVVRVVWCGPRVFGADHGNAPSRCARNANCPQNSSFVVLSVWTSA